MNFSKFSKNALLAAGLVAAMSSCNKDMKDEISTTKGNVESNQAALAAQNDASEAEIAKQDSLRALDIANALAASEAEAAEEAAEEAAAAAEEAEFIAANAGYTYSNEGTATISVEGTNTNGDSYKKDLALNVTNKAGNTYKVEEKFGSGSYYVYDQYGFYDYTEYYNYSYTKETWHVTLWANTGSSAQEQAMQSMVNVTITRNSDLSGATENIVTTYDGDLYLDEARISSGSYDLTQDDGFNFWEADGSIYRAGSSSYGFGIESFSYDVASHDIAFDLFTTNEDNDDIELEIEIDSKILREISTSYIETYSSSASR
jgi:hypothetical protein